MVKYVELLWCGSQPNSSNVLVLVSIIIIYYRGSCGGLPEAFQWMPKFAPDLHSGGIGTVIAIQCDLNRETIGGVAWVWV